MWDLIVSVPDHCLCFNSFYIANNSENYRIIKPELHIGKEMK